MQRTIEIEWWRIWSQPNSDPVAEEVLEQHKETLLQVALMEIQKQMQQGCYKGNFDTISLTVDRDNEHLASYRGYWELAPADLSK